MIGLRSPLVCSLLLSLLFVISAYSLTCLILGVYALVALQKDTKLREARASLVPKEIDEDGFWRNYFFRVNLLKRAFSLLEGPQCKEGASTLKSDALRQMLISSSGADEDIPVSRTPTPPPPKEDEPNISALLDASNSMAMENDAENGEGPNTIDSLNVTYDSPHNESIGTDDSSMFQLLGPPDRLSDSFSNSTARSVHLLFRLLATELRVH